MSSPGVHAEAPGDVAPGPADEAPAPRKQPRRRRPLSAALGAGLALLGLGSALVLEDQQEAPAARLVGGNLPVNQGAPDPLDISAHNSPSLARNPTNGANLVVTNRIDSPDFSCALHVSTDGGSRWSQTAIPVPAGEEPKCYAPDVAFGADGTMYLSFVTLKGVGNVPNAVWMSRSVDGGRTLTAPSPMLGPLAFQVRVVADPGRPGRLYRTWLQASTTGLYSFPTPGNPVLFARSDDGGRTWSEAVRVVGPSRSRVVAPSLAVGPRGRLYVLSLDMGDDALDYGGGHEGLGGPPHAGRWALVLSRSLDDGGSWSETVVDDRITPVERVVVFVPPFPSLAVDPSNGRVHVVFHDGRPGDPDVFAWSSRDEGRTFAEAVRVNDTARGDGTAQYLPKAAVSPDGRLDVLYYDRRADREDLRNNVSLQSSFDGGRTFGRHVRLADRAFDSRIGFGSERGLPDLGSRLALLSTPSSSLAVWTDTRAGTEASRKQDLVAAFVEHTRPAPASSLRRAGYYGGLGLAVVGAALLLLGVMPRRPSAPPSSPPSGPP